MKTLGKNVLLSSQTERFAMSLVKECDGLPLGITIMAGSMRGVDDIREWRNALKEIKEAKYRNEDMEFFEVFRVLKYSYDKLKDPKVQECFLYCSLFPEDWLIKREELIEYFIDEKLIDGMDSRESRFDKGHSILNKLEYVCLLEAALDAEHAECVKMHDLVRDMAIKIATQNPHRYSVQLPRMFNYGEWSADLLRVSLMGNITPYVPFNGSPRCPRLLTLLLCTTAH